MEKIKQTISVCLAMLSMPFIIVYFGLLKLAGVDMYEPGGLRWPLWVAAVMGVITIISLAVYCMPGLIAYIATCIVLFIWWLMKLLRH